MYAAAHATSNYSRVYPSAYSYHGDSVYRSERPNANCRQYGLNRYADTDQYVYCGGTQLRLTDSHYGSEQYTASSEYYVWTGGSRSQLLFIFPTRVNMTTITLHYYTDSVRGLPRLRFYAVPDGFDIWDAPTSSYNYVDVVSVPPDEEPVGRRNITIATTLNTKKVLMYKFTSSFAFAMSEVEFSVFRSGN